MKRGGCHSEETKRKISESHKDKHHSEEIKRKISKANKGRKFSKEHKEKIGKANKGKKPWNKGIPRSNEIKKKISETSKGRKCWCKDKHHSEKAKKKMSESHKGKKLPEETRKKLREANKGEKNPNYGKHFSKEAKRKMSEKALFRIQNYKGPFKDTKPELKMKEILNELNISFKHQFRLRNRLFDFHILNTNILIEVDGDWWHGNPKIYEKLNMHQRKAKQKDLEKGKLAKENNFILLRFWQSDILNNIKEVEVKLKDIYNKIVL